MTNPAPVDLGWCARRFRLEHADLCIIDVEASAMTRALTKLHGGDHGLTVFEHAMLGLYELFQNNAPWTDELHEWWQDGNE